MTFDEIVAELKVADLPPAEALRAAVPHAAELAREVEPLVSSFCRGVCLSPGEESLLFYGLHVLAAARLEALLGWLIALARAPGDELAWLFQENADTSLACLILRVWDGDGDALLHLIEHADMVEDSKWALFDVMARLTFDGRIPREQATGFLERFEREALVDDDSGVWWAWATAVTRLGIVELEPALRRVWLKPAFESFEVSEHDHALADMRRSAADPRDPSAFEAAGIVAAADPVEALAWMGRRHDAHARWLAENEASDGVPGSPAHIAEDPAAATRLCFADLHWLGRFLQSRQVPPTCMPLEMVDGFVTALAIGPEVVPAAEYLPAIWGSEGGEEPVWADAAQSRHVLGLIERHIAAIVQRREANAAQVPLIETVGDDIRGADWAEGFLFGIELRGEAWEPLWRDRRGIEELLAIQALIDGDTELLERSATADERASIIARLPLILRRIAAYWRDPARVYPRPEPIRVEKIGRNDPCPCGSGKKYKKCCALNPPTVMH